MRAPNMRAPNTVKKVMGELIPVTLVLMLAAPFIGSFLGVLVVRTLDGRPIILARSECDACRRPLAATELVPVVSWIALRGRCRTCGERLSLFYPLMEIGAVLP